MALDSLLRVLLKLVTVSELLADNSAELLLMILLMILLRLRAENENNSHHQKLILTNTSLILA